MSQGNPESTLSDLNILLSTKWDGLFGEATEAALGGLICLHRKWFFHVMVGTAMSDHRQQKAAYVLETAVPVAFQVI